ncbi:MAG: helix-turn-helix domain-containing protein [Bacteroidales bacterium]|nr:helix-turn-helix domain-containing protein [Bacteroidales bacterium]
MINNENFWVFSPQTQILNPFIKYIYILKHNSKETIGYTLPPTTSPIVGIFNGVCFDNNNTFSIESSGESFLTSRIISPRDISSIVEFKGNIEQIGLVLTSYALKAFSFFEMPIYEIKNQLLNPLEVFGEDVNFLLEELYETTDVSKKRMIIEKYFCSKIINLNLDKRMIYATKYIDKNASNTNLSSLSNKLNISSKTLNRLFKEYTGITPKKYVKLTRFNNTISALKNLEIENFTKVSLQYGYFDQSHFIKDCKEFCGDNPKNVLKNLIPYYERILWQ